MRAKLAKILDSSPITMYMQKFNIPALIEVILFISHVPYITVHPPPCPPSQVYPKLDKQHTTLMMQLWCWGSYAICVSESEGGHYIDSYIVWCHIGLGWTFGYSHSQVQSNSIADVLLLAKTLLHRLMQGFSTGGRKGPKSRSQDHFSLVVGLCQKSLLIIKF